MAASTMCAGLLAAPLSRLLATPDALRARGARAGDAFGAGDGRGRSPADPRTLGADPPRPPADCDRRVRDRPAPADVAGAAPGVRPALGTASDQGGGGMRPFPGKNPAGHGPLVGPNNVGREIKPEAPPPTEVGPTYSINLRPRRHWP